MTEISHVRETETVQGLWVPPEIPSRYEVIPIHNSDRGNYKRCRRYFDWTSPARQNLSLRADINGINTDMWFGTGIHWALEQYYNPGLKRDPVESWKTWFDVQWRGGVVTEEWLDRVYDLEPRPEIHGTVAGHDGKLGHPHVKLWRVRGLMDILPDADEEVFDSLLDLGINMMSAYKGYAAHMDGFEVLVTEHDFSVPIWDFENECILKAVDLREQSPNYGKTLEVHNRGRMDAIWVKPNGKLGIIDHKTSSRIDEDFFEKLDTDEQCTSYLFAAEVEAKYYDLPYAGQPIEEVTYNVLRKTYPKPPTIVRGGLFSIDRANESCTYEMLMEWITQNQINVDDLPLQHQTYISYLRDIGDEQYFIRKHVRRNRHQLANASYRLYQEAMDMLDPNLRIYPNLRNDYSCLRCAFRAPCLAREDGSDWEQLIRDNYVRQRDR